MILNCRVRVIKKKSLDSIIAAAAAAAVAVAFFFCALHVKNESNFFETNKIT